MKRGMKKTIMHQAATSPKNVYILTQKGQKIYTHRTTPLSYIYFLSDSNE